MHRTILTLLYLPLLALLLWAGMQTAQLHAQAKEAQDISAGISALTDEREALQSERTQRILKISTEQPKASFKPLDVPLSDELQRNTWDLCEQYDVSFEIIIAIGEHESGWIWPGEIIDNNCLPSVGYMQINQPCWDYLAGNGIDVHTERGNIHAAVFLLSELLEKYPLEKALCVYQCGETGAQGIESTEFSRWVMERAEYWQEHTIRK